MSTINKKANSKKSISVIVIKFIPSLFLILALTIVRSPINTLPLAVPVVFALMTLFRCHYTVVDNSFLILHVSFKKKVIPLESIYHISGEKSVGFHNWFINYSNSLKGVEITYGENRKLIISPENSEDFLAFLEKNIKNDTLV